MTIYEKPVRHLMRDMVDDLKIDFGKIISKEDAIEWFKVNYPMIKEGTIKCHLIKMSVNSPTRLHYSVIPIEDDLFYKIDSNNFRLFDSRIDPSPIWSEKDIPEGGKLRSQGDKDYKPKIIYLLQNAEKLHNVFYDVATFTGPSLFFHEKALEYKDSKDRERYLEYIYATLVSWGMHRMGSKGSKMLDFQLFRNSIESLKDEISIARNIDPRDIKGSDWYILKKIFSNTKIMATGTSIVGNSKVMAHLLPHIIPPIDRAYTLRYLGENINNGLEDEWLLMRKIISEFFIPVFCDKNFIALSEDWQKSHKQYQWDTSSLKIIDNLIIAAVKLQGNRKKFKSPAAIPPASL